MKKVCLAVLPALTIVLELLPFGAVCIFATSPTERVKETFSYFSLTPFGYANFAPLITATLTVAIFLLSLFSLKKKGVLKALFVLYKFRVVYLYYTIMIPSWKIKIVLKIHILRTGCFFVNFENINLAVKNLQNTFYYKCYCYKGSYKGIVV